MSQITGDIAPTSNVNPSIHNCSYYGAVVNHIRPIIDRLALLVAGTLGRIIGRPSEALLSELAAADRGASNPVPTDSPMIEASNHIQLGQAAFAAAS